MAHLLTMSNFLNRKLGCIINVNMRKDFEFDLSKQSSLVKREAGMTNDTEDINLSDLENELEQMLQNQDSGSIEVQHEIFELQKQKQEIMLRLKEDLVCLDNPECAEKIRENERLTTYDNITKSFVYHDDKNEERLASFGEMVTDMDWDVYYHFDRETTPRTYLKKYLVEKAKAELRDLLDKQIIVSEIGNKYVNQDIQDTYANVRTGRELGADKRRNGFISETIVKNFLRQLTLDNDLPFEVKQADVFQDVEQKMDFIIHKREEALGVRVEEDAEATDVAIQFTINTEAKAKKERQIEKVEKVLKKNHEKITDIALVVFPIAMANKLKSDWERTGKIAGGPGKFLSPEVEQKLFFELLKDIFTAEQIEKYWEEAQAVV